MAEAEAKSKNSTSRSGSASRLTPGEMPINIYAQYIKDLSFENPGAPDSLRGGLPAPQMNVSVSLDMKELKGDTKNLYEVMITLKASAMRGDKAAFIAELAYGVTVSIGESVPEEQHHPILFIEIPRHAFPFARQILAAVTTQAGFPPLLITPVDFQALYVHQFKDHIQDGPDADTKMIKVPKKA